MRLQGVVSPILRGALLALALVGARPAFAAPAEFEAAKKLYAQTQYREAISVLGPISGSNDAAVQSLLGKSYFMTGDYKRAADAFEASIRSQPNDSVTHHWLGKAYGRRAETSNPLLAPGLASKARQSFERAVSLDSKNLEAINDLLEYYLEAPGFLGGGLDKAAGLAEKIKTLDPVEYHFALAQIAQKRKDLSSAERHFREAASLAPRQVGRLIDLARFLSKAGRLQESETVFQQAEKVAPNEPRLLFERAASYVRAKRNLSQAKSLLERYLRSPLTPDDPPRAEAERLLKQVSAGAA
ncbi:MAG TPA: tetratricopeptide repeat protein [Bryobacteraceae bacterium]|nr:tetratricopeptide repeat protein [Bryobacteraceae bacterium]